MPLLEGLTPEVKVRILKNRGLNPDQYDIDPQGNISQKSVEEQPSSAPDSLTVNQPKTTVGQALGSHALASTIPTIAGLGIPAAALALAPETGGLSLLALGLGSMYGASKLQEPLLTDKFKQQLGQTQQEHPVASTIGEFAPSFPFFNPVKGVMALPKVAGAAKTLAVEGLAGRGMKALTGEQQALLKNTAINTGISTGQDIYNQSQSPEPFSIPELLTSAGLASVLNTPTRLGKRVFGFHGSEPSEVNKQPQAKPQTTTVPDAEYVTGNDQGPLPFIAQDSKGKYTLADSVVNDIYAREFPESAKTSVVKGQGINKPNQTVKLTTEQKRQMLQDKQMEKFGAGGDIQPFNEPSTIPQADPLLKEFQQNRQEYEYQREQLTKQNEQLKSSLENIKNLQPSVETPVKPEVTRLPGEPLYSKESQLSTIPEGTGMKLSDLAERDRQRLIELQNKQGAKRGMKPAIMQPEVKSESGIPVAGKITPSERQPVISNTLGGPGTIPHENAGHGFVNDLLNSPDPADRKLGQRGLEVFKQHPLGAEEGLAISQERNLGTRNMGELGLGPKTPAFKAWWKDVIDHFKYRLGSTDPDVVSNHIASAYLRDAPFNARDVMFPHMKASSMEDKTKTASMEPEGPKISSQQNAELTSGSSQYSRDLNARLQQEGQKSKEAHALEMQRVASYSKTGISTKAKSLEDLGYKLPRYSWLSPDGKVIDVGLNDHNDVAKQKLGEMGFHVPEEYGHAGESLKKMGYVRLVKGESILNAENEHKLVLNNNQRRTLVDASTFEGKKLMFNGRDISEKYSGESQIPNNKNEGIPDKEKIQKNFLSKQDAEYSSLNQRYNDKNFKNLEELDKFNKKESKAYSTGKEIESKLQEASFREAKEEIKEANLRQDNERLQDEPIEPNQNEKEAQVKAHKKTEELEAFTRPDVERHSEESQIPPPDKSSYSVIPPWAAQNDKVRKLDKPLAHAFDLAAQTKNFKRAEWVNVPMSDIGDINASKEERNNAFLFVRNKFRGKPVEDIPITPKTQQVIDIVKPLWNDMAKQFKEARLKVRTSYGDLRERGVSEYYGPDMLSDVNKEILTKKAGSQEAKDIMDEWAKYVSEESNGEIPFDEALQNIKEYSQALGRRNIHDIEFGALRKAQGYGVPDSLRETDLLKVLTQYGTRAAADFSYWKHLQSDPYVAAKLSLPKLEGGKTRTEGVEALIPHPDVVNALRFFTGDFVSKNTPRTTAVIRAYLGNLLQTATQVRNTVQTFALLSPYVETTKDVKTFFTSFGNLKDAYRKALEYGSRSGSMDLDKWHTLDTPDVVTNGLNKISESIRKWSGRAFLENFDRAYTFEVGRRLGLNKVLDAANGNVKAQQWLEKFGLGVKDLKNITPEDLNIIGSNMVDRVQGTYDQRGLPIGAFDSQFAPFFALSRWGIEKSNVIWKDVLNPAIKGENYLPLLTYTLGTLMTGAAIRQLNELMSGKKDYTPSVGEALTADRKDFLLASFINLLQQGSYAGIIGDAARTASDIFIQHEYPKGPISFPAADFLTTTLGQNLSDYMSAMENGGDPLETSFNLISNIAKSSVQNYRLLHSAIFDRENTERGNKFRDIRTFKKLEGEEVPAISSFHGNQLENKDIQEFKRTPDVGKAVELLPQLISKAIEKSKGDPYKLKQELTKIKENSYQTIPDMKNAPIEFVRYMQYLSKTQGPEEASNRLADYMTQGAINKAKSGMVP